MRFFAPAFLLLLLSSCTSLNSLRNQAQLHPAPNLHCQLPIEQVRHLLVIPVNVPRQPDTLRFIFDTGAGLTILSQERATQLGLKPIKKITVRDSHGQKSKLNVVMIPEISIGCARIQNVVAAVVDYGPNSIIPCVAQDGILGNNIIRLLNWKHTGHDSLELGTSTLLAKDDSVVATLPLSGSIRPLLALQINGKKTENLLLDTGSGGAIDIKPSTAKALVDSTQLVYKEIDGSSQGLFGSMVDTTLGYVSSVHYGSAEPNGLVEVAPSTTEKVGMAWLNRYAWILPAQQRQLHLLHKEVDTAFALHSFGLTVLLADGKLMVTSLELNSQAANSGIQHGMTLSYLNGKTAANFHSLCDYLLWYRNQGKLEEWVLAVEGWKDGIFLSKTNLLAK